MFRLTQQIKQWQLSIHKIQCQRIFNDVTKKEEIKKFVIPLVEPWKRQKPWPLQMHPQSKRVIKESNEWLKQHHVKPDVGDYTVGRNFPTFACLTLPTASHEQVRILSDFMAFWTESDDHIYFAQYNTDMKNTVEKDLKNLKSFDSSNLLVKIFSQLLNRLKEAKMPEFLINNFIEECIKQKEISKLQYMYNKDIPFTSIVGFVEYRRLIVGSQTLYPFIKWISNVPENLLNHPLIKFLDIAATDFSMFTNDIVSYPSEYVLECTNNCVTFLRKIENISSQEAMDKVAYFSVEAMDDIDKLDAVIEKSDIKSDQWAIVHSYVEGIRLYCSAIIKWHFDHSKARYLNLSNNKQFCPDSNNPSHQNFRNFDQYFK